MTTTKTKAAAKPAAKKPAAKPAPIDDPNVVRVPLSAIPPEDMPDPISAEARLHALLEERERAMAILGEFFGTPPDPGLEAMAETAVGYARELEATIKAGKAAASPACEAVGRILTETILSGRGEVQITIRPYVAPTQTEAEP